jgi:hypothetical protein
LAIIHKRNTVSASVEIPAFPMLLYFYGWREDVILIIMKRVTSVTFFLFDASTVRAYSF